MVSCEIVSFCTSHGVLTLRLATSVQFSLICLFALRAIINRGDMNLLSLLLALTSRVSEGPTVGYSCHTIRTAAPCQWMLLMS